MRVTNRMTTRNYVRSLNSTMERLSQTQQKLESGKRIRHLSEDVAAGSRAMRAEQEIYKIQQRVTNISGASGELASAEGVLKDIKDMLTQTIGPDILRALNLTSSSTVTADQVRQEQKVIASSLTGLREQLLQFSNARYSNKYLFGGVNNAGAPFTLDRATNELLFNGVAVDSIYKDAADGKYKYDTGTPPAPVEIPMDEDMYLDVGLGLVMAAGKIDPSTAFNVSFSGMDILGAGTTPLDVMTTDADGNAVVRETIDAPNNLYNLLTEIADGLTSGDMEKVRALNDQLTKRADEVTLHWTDLGNRSNFLERQTERLTNEEDALENLKKTLLGINEGEESINLSTVNRVLTSTLAFGAQILPMSLMDFIS